MCYSVGARGQQRLEGNSRTPELKKRGLGSAVPPFIDLIKREAFSGLSMRNRGIPETASHQQGEQTGKREYNLVI